MSKCSPLSFTKALSGTFFTTNVFP